MSFAAMNWGAVALGTVLAYALGMLWFSPRMFGRAWSAGSHNITPPASVPVAAMGAQLVATLLLALAIGLTETAEDLVAALLIILTGAMLQLAGGLFSQKSLAAALIDGAYVIAMGALMIVAQAIL